MEDTKIFPEDEIKEQLNNNTHHTEPKETENNITDESNKTQSNLNDENLSNPVSTLFSSHSVLPLSENNTSEQLNDNTYHTEPKETENNITEESNKTGSNESEKKDTNETLSSNNSEPSRRSYTLSLYPLDGNMDSSDTNQKETQKPATFNERPSLETSMSWQYISMSPSGKQRSTPLLSNQRSSRKTKQSPLTHTWSQPIKPKFRVYDKLAHSSESVGSKLENIPFDAESFESARRQIELGNIEEFKSIIEKMNINMRDPEDEQNTLLHWAVGYNQISITTTLIQAGALQLPNDRGITPLHLATKAYQGGNQSYYIMMKFLTPSN